MSRLYVFTEYGGPETEALIDRPVPEPGPSELLVEVRAAGVNPADWKLRESWFGRDGDLPRAMGAVTLPPSVPAIPMGLRLDWLPCRSEQNQDSKDLPS